MNQLPYRLTLRVLADLMVVGFLAAGGVLVLAMAQGTVPAPNSPDFPWATVIQALGTGLVALFTWLVKIQVTKVHLSINSKMDSLLDLTAKAARAEGVIAGQESAAAAAAAAAAKS